MQTTTPIADVLAAIPAGGDLALALDDAGTWRISPFSDGSYEVIGVDVRGFVLMTPELGAEHGIVTLGDAIQVARDMKTSREELVSKVAIAILNGAVLLAPKTSVGPVSIPSGAPAWGCWQVNDLCTGAHETGGMLSRVENDWSPWGAADMFVALAGNAHAARAYRVALEKARESAIAAPLVDVGNIAVTSPA